MRYYRSARWLPIPINSRRLYVRTGYHIKLQKKLDHGYKTQSNIMIKSMTVVDKTARKSSGLFRKQIVFCLWDFRLSVYGSKFRTSTAATRENKSIAPTLDAGRSRKPIHTFSSFDYIKMNGIPSVFEFQRKLDRHSRLRWSAMDTYDFSIPASTVITG